MIKLDAKKIGLLSLALALFVQLVTAVSLLSYSHRTKVYAEKNGRIINLACRAYDPFSPFKGRYVRLSFEEERISSKNLDKESFQKHTKRGEQYYFRMEEGSDSLWTVRGIRKELPSEDSEQASGKSKGIYIKGKTYHYMLYPSATETVSASFPFSEYYMQENFAQYVDTISTDDFNNLKPVLSLYVDKKGQCIQKGLTVLNGTDRISIEEYCRIKTKQP
ncbi:MAG: GDYXXLXY domain-containing protein [Treponema sp.]|nr:GDYXXLXY domain-containing protein [Treponema sp.]